MSIRSDDIGAIPFNISRYFIDTTTRVVLTVCYNIFMRCNQSRVNIKHALQSMSSVVDEASVMNLSKFIVCNVKRLTCHFDFMSYFVRRTYIPLYRSSISWNRLSWPKTLPTANSVMVTAMNQQLHLHVCW